jgi:hypothetical protein
MADEHHIVLEMKKGKVAAAYMATIQKLESAGWQNDGIQRDIQSAWVQHDGTRKKLDEPCEKWDANGAEAWVSIAAYPATKKVRLLE